MAERLCQDRDGWLRTSCVVLPGQTLSADELVDFRRRLEEEERARLREEPWP